MKFDKIDLKNTDELLVEERLMEYCFITHGDENVDVVAMLKRFVASRGLNVWFDGKHWGVNHVRGHKDDKHIFATRSEAYQFLLTCIVNTTQKHAADLDTADTSK